MSQAAAAAVIAFTSKREQVIDRYAVLHMVLRARLRSYAGRDIAQAWLGRVAIHAGR
jgi:hypothetical protein